MIVKEHIGPLELKKGDIVVVELVDSPVNTYSYHYYAFIEGPNNRFEGKQLSYMSGYYPRFYIETNWRYYIKFGSPIEEPHGTWTFRITVER